jgi:hypothetical protein
MPDRATYPLFAEGGIMLSFAGRVGLGLAGESNYKNIIACQMHSMVDAIKRGFW